MLVFCSSDERISKHTVTAMYVEKENHTIIISDEESAILANKLGYIELIAIKRDYRESKLDWVFIDFVFPEFVTLNFINVRGNESIRFEGVL